MASKGEAVSQKKETGSWRGKKKWFKLSLHEVGEGNGNMLCPFEN